MKRINIVGRITPKDNDNIHQNQEVFKGGICSTIKASCYKEPYKVVKKMDRQKISRNGLGGIYISVSQDYQRGLLKGISRTLKANNHDACAICKVRVRNDKENDYKRSDG